MTRLIPLAELPRHVSPTRPPRRRVLPPASQWELDGAITVVLFAGLGGACAGLEEAGCPVHVANNHDDVALAAHAALHPHTRHVKGSIFDVEPLEATRGRRVKVLWASPDCTDHSVAKGGAPRSARVRSLPWQVCRWAGKTMPQVIMMENVREIRGWGPLVAKRCKATGRVLKLDGSVAALGERVPRREQQLVRDKRHLGRSFHRFVAHIRSLGYAYEDRDLCCADFGVPTSRRRWFAVARRDGVPIDWPARTHAPRDVAASLGLLPWVSAASIIDWSLPLPSIFERKRPLVNATMRRVAVGLKRYVLDNPRPFIVPLTHTGSDRVHDGADPLRTLTTARRGELAVIAPYLAGCGGRAAQTPPSSPEAPVGTITAKGDRVVCAATMVQTGYGEAPGQAPRALDIEAPIGTQVAGGAKHAVVGAWMVQHNFGLVGRAAATPLSTLTTRGTQQQVAAAYLTIARGQSTANDAEGPLPAPTSGGHVAATAAYLIKLRGTSTAQDSAQPVPALSAGGNHVAATAAFLTSYYTGGSAGQPPDLPLHTLTTLARFGVVGVLLEGLPYVVVDVGMRMLEPSEAAAAHELALPAIVEIDGNRRRLTKSEAMRLVGNSVPKRMARLLAQANAAHTLVRPEKMAAD